MKLKEVKWSALKFSDRTILPKDLVLMSVDQRHALMETEVKKVEGTRYTAVR